MMQAPIHPTPARYVPRPKDWRPDAPLEYDRDGFLFPARRPLLERVYLWVCSAAGKVKRISGLGYEFRC